MDGAGSSHDGGVTSKGTTNVVLSYDVPSAAAGEAVVPSVEPVVDEELPQAPTRGLMSRTVIARAALPPARRGRWSGGWTRDSYRSFMVEPRLSRQRLKAVWMLMVASFARVGWSG